MKKQKEKKSELFRHHSHKITFKGKSAIFTVLGALSLDLSSLRITLHIKVHENLQKHRCKIDLFEVNQVQKLLVNVSEKYQIKLCDIEADIRRLTELLEAYQEKLFEEEFGGSKQPKISLTLAKEKEAISLLKSPDLIDLLQNILGEVGIVGEVKTRVLIFVIASSYKMQNPIHAIIQASSGSGKSHLINSIAECMPKEDVISFTRVTSKSLYHYSKEELVNKLLLIQDFDGLDEEAQYSFRELQSHGELTTSITYKDRFGNIQSKVKSVKGCFASLGATTNQNIYEDNLSRSILLKIDESAKQSNEIIHFQNQKLAGKLNEHQIELNKQQLVNLIRVLKPFKVLNKYSDKIALPSNVKSIRRLNNQFLKFVSQITLLHQFQREFDKQNRLLTTKEDIRISIELFFDVIWLKIDELDGSTRQFFEELKSYIKTQIKTSENSLYKFNQRELRNSLNLSKTGLHRKLTKLLELEFISIVGGTKNRGYKYQIKVWDDVKTTKEKLKNDLINQLNQIK